MISIYIHIPFCIKKCAYCDFLSFPSDEVTIQRYLNCLLNEIDGCDVSDREVASVFFGGGTPSILSSEQIEKILAKIKEEFNLLKDCEISMECNPGTASEEKLLGYRKAGVNRLSIGLQSANDFELKNLGRIHNYNQFLETYNLARKSGFENINVDLMSALPGQTIESYRDTLTKVVTLNPQHLSAYSLIIEENTEFWGLYGDEEGEKCNKGQIAKLPDEDAERAMYYMTNEVLDRFGYHRYEISNYAKEGYECRHNKVYWTGGDYVGFGIGAASFLNGKRYNNISDVAEYMEIWSDSIELSSECGGDENSVKNDDGKKDFFPKDKNGMSHVGEHLLSQNDRMEEYMFLGLRLMEGISVSAFEEKFGLAMRDVYGDVIDRYAGLGMLEFDGDRLKLTDKGIDVSNVILADFLLDD